MRIDSKLNQTIKSDWDKNKTPNINKLRTYFFTMVENNVVVFVGDKKRKKCPRINKSSQSCASKDAIKIPPY